MTGSPLADRGEGKPLATDRVPVPAEFWPLLRLLRQRLREQHGVRLTYPQIGDALGYSSTRVKQLLNNWEQVKTPDGWRMRPPGKDTDGNGE